MSKKLLICLLIGISSIILIGCNKTKFIVKETSELNELEGVSMTIKEGTLTRVSTTIIITDLSGEDNTYGSQYRIDKRGNNKWTSLKTIDGKDWTEVAWTLIGYNVDKNNKLEMDINWENLYGKLENGEYRIVKDTSTFGELENHYFSVEFIIE